MERISYSNELMNDLLEWGIDIKVGKAKFASSIREKVIEIYQSTIISDLLYKEVPSIVE